MINPDEKVKNLLSKFTNLNKFIVTGRKYYKPSDKSIFLTGATWLQIYKAISLYPNAKGFFGDKRDEIFNLSKNDYSENNIPHIMTSSSVMTILSTWTYTKGVYKIDKELQRELSKSEYKGNLDVEMFERLPEYAICIQLEEEIELKHHNGYDLRFDTFWVTLTSDNNGFKLLLATVYDYNMNSFNHIYIPLNENIGIDSFEFDNNNELYMEAKMVEGKYVSNVRQILPYILYIVSEGADISNENQEYFTPKQINEIQRKGELKLFVADKVTVYNVGNKIGEKIRKYYKDLSSNGGTVRPHIRRGHWHTYLTGSRSGKRERVLKWLFPMFINEDKVEA